MTATDRLNRECQQIMMGGVVDIKQFFAAAMLMPFFVFAGFCLLQLVRWVNVDAETRHIRLLWIGLWCSGGGFLLVGIFMLWHAVPQLPQLIR